MFREALGDARKGPVRKSRPLPLMDGTKLVQTG
jgi:hypothetical protein